MERQLETRYVIQNTECFGEGEEADVCFYGAGYRMYGNIQYANRYKTKEGAQSDYEYVYENCSGDTQIIEVLQDEKTFRVYLPEEITSNHPLPNQSSKSCNQ